MTTSENIVYVVDDDPSPREAIVGLVRSAGYATVSFASAAAFLAHPRRGFRECLVLDIEMPELSGLELQQHLNAANDRLPIIFVTGHGDVPMSVAAIKAGASDFLMKPFDAQALLEAIQRALPRLPSENHTSRIIGSSPAIAEMLRQIESVATTDTTILLQGETGTGKESLARAIHERSGRTGRFIKVNCAAIPAGLLESELMGHEKGSFTGAVAQRIGRFELAQDGTIFLDEIGELPLELQPKLLRVLQEREFERIGGTRTVQSSARVVTATNRNLTAMVAGKMFREDLYYRLAVFPIHVPPLRDRAGDIPLLANHFVAAHAHRLGKHVDPPSPELLAGLGRYAWPGNIRELQNVLERAVIMATGGALEIPQLATEPTPPPANAVPTTCGFDVTAFIREQLTPPRRDLYGETHRQVDRVLLTLALEHTHGNQREAARLVGISRQTMRTRMRSLGLHVARAVETDGTD